MKNLITYKLFESNDRLWDMLTEEEYEQVYDDSQKWRSFDQMETNSIEKLLPGLYFNKSFDGLLEKEYKNCVIEYYSYKGSYKHIRIIKLDDEWYWVLYSTVSKTETYKCDTFQGLLDLLNLLSKKQPISLYNVWRNLVESNQEGNLWDTITVEEYDERAYNSENWKAFDQKEIASIGELLPNFKIKIDKAFGETSSIEVDDKSDYFRITKLDDEWYLVWDTFTDEYYKCDTFQGLLDLIDWIKRWASLKPR